MGSNPNSHLCVSRNSCGKFENHELHGERTTWVPTSGAYEYIGWDDYDIDNNIIIYLELKIQFSVVKF